MIEKTKEEKQTFCQFIKSSRQLVNNHRLVSFLPKRSKLTQIKLLNSCRPGFMTNDSFVNHLFSISHNIYQAFDAKASPNVRGVFKGI